MICLTLKPSESFIVNHIQSKEKFLSKKSFLKPSGSGGWRIEQKIEKEAFLTALLMAIKKEPTASVRKHTNELKVNKKTGDDN